MILKMQNWLQGKKSALTALIIYTTVLGIGILGGFVLCHELIFRCISAHHLIDGRFVCGSNSLVLDKGSYRDFRQSLQQYIIDEKKAGHVSEISVFFRDLRAGPYFGIDEKNEFIPASLLKLPQAMAFYSMEEDAPGILSERVMFKKSNSASTLSQTFAPQKKLEVGHAYTIQELIELSLSESNNDAYDSLNEYLQSVPNGVEYMLRVFKHLGVEESGDITAYTTDVRGYSSLFRTLYSSSYLTSTHSEEVLGILLHSTFTDGLRGGVPEDVAVAHKFGERFLPDHTK